MKKIYFVSGIDTGVGKSFATGMMARFLLARDRRAATVKLVQTGCRESSEDLELHRKLMGRGPLPEDAAKLTAPRIFLFPASPHFAAARENREVEPEKIAAAVTEVAAHYDMTLVEGAGGLAVPLTPDLLTIDFAAERHWPTILVTSGRLGSLNHTILSLEALRARAMECAGVIFNFCSGADPEISADTRRMIRRALRRYGFCARIADLGEVDPDHPEKTACDFSPIFFAEETRP